MHYLDHVFGKQFPFYEFLSVEGGRLWLLSCLTSYQSAYFATLALSALDAHTVQNSGKDAVDGGNALGEFQILFDKASQYLQRDVERLQSTSGDSGDLKMIVGVSIALIQLITYEVSTHHR